MFFVLGMLITTFVCWGIAFTVNKPRGIRRSGEISGPNGYWTVTLWRASGVTLVESVRGIIPNRQWGTEQVIGPPNTGGPGDIVTAWASKTQDNQMEWLVLDYAEAVVPDEVHVYETYNPGALFKVSVFNSRGEEIVVWEGNDPTPTNAGIGVSKIPVKVDFKTNRVKIYLDSPAVNGWNEIDAVALIDNNHQTQWACGVGASTTYASGSAVATTPEKLIPSWAKLETPTQAFASGSIKSEHRIAAGFGWPFVALAYEFVVEQGVNQNAFSSSTNLSQVFPPMFIPYRPILIGFLLNSVIYAIGPLVIFLAIRRPLHIYKEFMRMRRGCCVICGYNLRYDFKQGCPECGWLRE